MAALADTLILVRGGDNARPEMAEATLLAAGASRAPVATGRYDVICCPGVDGDVSVCQPRELMSEFAARGHRVFLLGRGAHLLGSGRDVCIAESSAPNLCEVRCEPAEASTNGTVSGEGGRGLVAALDALRRSHNIDTAVIYAQTPGWGAAAIRARARWGWPVVYDRVANWDETPGPRVDRPVQPFEQLLMRQADVVVAAAETDELDGALTTGQVAVVGQGTAKARRQRLERAIRAAVPRASIVIVTYNSLPYTKLCLASLLTNTAYPSYEVIIVDNGSTDGTPSYLTDLARRHSNVRVLLNEHNQGFGPATNHGLAEASGDVFVLLNNDTVVPPGWLTRLAHHLEDPRIGLLGPETNRTCNEAQIDVPYEAYGAFVRFARERMWLNEGDSFDIPMLAMFCTALRRDVYEQVGPLDERYQIGTFEDEDYALRVRATGLRVVCARDVFVHHANHASMGSLIENGDYARLFTENRHRFEQKWGVQWESHWTVAQNQARNDRIAEIAETIIPVGATVLVATEGDGRLLHLTDRDAVPFPQGEDGRHADYAPLDGAAVVAHFEALRTENGAEYFILPAGESWWLEQYPEFRRHLETTSQTIVHRDDDAVILALSAAAPDDRRPWRETIEAAVAEHRKRVDRDPAILDWDTGMDLKRHFPALAVFSPPVASAKLPYVDRSIDMVAAYAANDETLAEARRVSSAAVITAHPAVSSADDYTALPGTSVTSLPVGGRAVGAVTVEWLSTEPAVPLPSASIVIPTYNGLRHLAPCLAALKQTLPVDFRGEIVVVDDASTDETAAFLARWIQSDERVKVLRNHRNVGFVMSCNRGAMVARSEMIVFLNNDTLPRGGWLEALLQTFHDYPDAGAVGGKLVYPDGRLQEAGGIIYDDGTGANFGRGGDPDAPLFNYVREVDYCSGALLATPQELFLRLGGFDVRFAPGYFEDSDYCFAVRAHGCRVYYQPESVIVHVEGGTGGTDLATGAKRHQVGNRATFADKWAEALKNQPSPPGRYGMATWHTLATRGKAQRQVIESA